MNLVKLNLKLFLITFLLIYVSGCSTSLTVKKLSSESENPEGVVYYLPKTEFKVDISRDLKSCPYYFEGNVYMDIDNSVTLKASNTKDLENSYLIDYDSLSSITKEYEIEIQLHKNGFIKSVNSSVNDRSSDIVKSVVSTAAIVASVNVAGPTGLASFAALTSTQQPATPEKMKKKEMPIVLCTEKSAQAIRNFKIYSQKIKTSQKILAQKITKVSDLVAKIKEATGDNPEGEHLNQAISELKIAHDIFTLDKNKLSEVKSVLSIKDTYNFSSSPSYEMKINEKSIKKWIISTPKEYMKLIGISEDISPESEEYKVVEAELRKLKNLIVKRTAINFSSPDLENRGENNIIKADGIVYRQGALVDIYICKPQGCDEDGLIKTERVMVADAGIVASLPFKNGAFQENAYEVNFSEEGVLERVKLKSNSQASKSAETLNDVAKQYYDYQTDKQKLEVADEEAESQSTIKELDTQIAILEKNNKLSELKTPVDNELQKLRREVELKTLLNNIDQMSTKEAQQELDRLVIRQKAEELLNSLE